MLLKGSSLDCIQLREKKMSESEDMSKETLKTEMQREKNMERNIQELWGNYKRYNIQLTKLLEGAEWGGEARELFIVTIVELPWEKAQKTPNIICTKKFLPKCKGLSSESVKERRVGRQTFKVLGEKKYTNLEFHIQWIVIRKQRIKDFLRKKEKCFCVFKVYGEYMAWLWVIVQEMVAICNNK